MCNLISVDMETADFDPKYDMACVNDIVDITPVDDRSNKPC